jgi:hypothetical protein
MQSTGCFSNIYGGENGCAYGANGVKNKNKMRTAPSFSSGILFYMGTWGLVSDLSISGFS